RAFAGGLQLRAELAPRREGALEDPGRAGAAVVVPAADERDTAVCREGNGAEAGRTGLVARRQFRALRDERLDRRAEADPGVREARECRLRVASLVEQAALPRLARSIAEAEPDEHPHGGIGACECHGLSQVRGLPRIARHVGEARTRSIRE